MQEKMFYSERFGEKQAEKRENESYRLSEYKFAACGLILSICIIAAKLFCSNRKYLHDLVYERNLITYDHVTENGEVMLRHAWQETLKHSNLWLPLLCGFLATYFTWMIVYLDSTVPGVEPPSPFSPSKLKQRSGHTFHLNYMFAVAIGLLVASYMFIKGVDLNYLVN